MSATVGLPQMVDLALGTPELGAVNFNVLHSLLHAIINKLNLVNVTVDIKEEDRAFLTKEKITADRGTDKQNDKGQAKPERDGADSAITALTETVSSSSGFDTISRRTPYHHLQDRVSMLEKQFVDLNSLPSNDDLFERSKAQGDLPARPVSAMWQNMQLTRRVDANEEGVSKVIAV